jgi:nucleoredoxin
MNLRLVPLALLCATVCYSAPITVKEIEFLVRQRTPEQEIVQAATQRRLLIPLDATGEEALRKVGATESLLAALRKPELALPAAAAQAEIDRQHANRMRLSESAAEDAAAHARQQKQAAANLSRPGAARQMLEGRLVRMEGDQLKPFDARSLEHVRLVAFYYSAMWCPPCRKFTPQLVETYKRLKAKYPTQFELVFVSADHDEFNMAEYMRTYRMPWPAVRFGAATDAINQFGGEGIPWLVAVSGSGLALTKNGVDKKYIQPGLVLGAIEEMLPNLAR